MEMIYCPNCGKPSGFKRALGFGTLFMVFITFGLWLLTIPLYPARCIHCGLTRGSAFLENLRTNPRRAITVSSVIAGIVILLLLTPARHTHQTTEQQPVSIAPDQDHNTRTRRASQDAATDSTESTDHKLHLVPNFSGTGAIEDGRTYSVALINGTPDIPLSTQLFVQGRVARFGYAGMRSRVFAILTDEQESEKSLLCAMRAEESAKVLSLYHVGESVQATGEYMGNMSLAGNPPMPVLSYCRVAGPRQDVVRPVVPEATADASVPPPADVLSPGQANPGVAQNTKAESSSDSNSDLRPLLEAAEVRSVEQRLFGPRASDLESYTSENEYLSGNVVVFEFCKPDSCAENGGMLAVDASAHNANGRAAGILYDETEVVVYLGDYGYKENLPSEFRTWMENENRAERTAAHYKNVRYVHRDDSPRSAQ